MTDELRPCPFCGGEAEKVRAKKNCLYWIHCKKCGSTSDHSDHVTYAVNWWNTRIPDLQLTTEILLEGKLNEMTIAMFKPKYEKLLVFARIVARRDCAADPDKKEQLTNYLNVRDARELLKELGEDE